MLRKLRSIAWIDASITGQHLPRRRRCRLDDALACAFGPAFGDGDVERDRLRAAG
jgi:hypothetical protein